MRSFLFSMYEKEKNTPPSANKRRKNQSTRRSQKNSQASSSPTKIDEQDAQYIEQLPINVILVGNGIPKQTFYPTQNKYRSLQQILKQNFLVGNLCKKFKLGDTKIRFKLLGMLSIDQIIYNRYEEVIQLWNSIREPKMFIFLCHQSNFDDMKQIYKFCKEVEHLHNRKTLNAEEMRRINKRRQNNKNCSPEKDGKAPSKQEELGNWVSGLIICDNFAADGSPQYRNQVLKCKKQSQQICEKFDLVYLQTNPGLLKITCKSIYFWATLLKFYEIGEVQKASFHVQKLNTYLANNKSYNQCLLKTQKQALKAILWGTIDCIEIIDQMILRIYTQIDELLDYILAIEEGVYEYAQSYCSFFTPFQTEPTYIGTKIDFILEKKEKISANIEILQLIRAKDQTKPAALNSNMIGNYNKYPVSKSAEVQIIYGLYTSILSQQSSTIQSNHANLLKKARSFIKSKLNQSLNYEVFQKIWEQSSILDSTIDDENQDSINEHQMNNRYYQAMNEELKKTKNLFERIFDTKLETIKNKIKNQFCVVRTEMEQKIQSSNIQNKNSAEMQKYMDVLTKMSQDIKCVEKLYTEILDQIESKLIQKLTLDLILFDQIVSINQANQNILDRIMMITTKQKDKEQQNHKSQNKHNSESPSNVMNKDELLNEYLTSFYLETLKNQLVNEKKARQLTVDQNTKTKQNKSQVQKQTEFNIRNELLQKLKKCTVKKRQYVNIFSRMIGEYEKVDITVNILEVLNKTSGTRCFELKYAKLNSKRSKKLNQILESEAEMFTQSDNLY